MADYELASGKLGDGGTYDLDFIDGNISCSVSYSSPLLNGDVTIEISLLEILRVAASKTDNAIDDLLIGLIAKALGADEDK